MKMKPYLTLCAAVCFAPLSHAAITQQWEFNDANGTLLENASNTGSVGGVSFASGLTNTTDGSGNYVVNTNVTGFKAANIADVNSGQLYYRMDVNGWNLDELTAFRNITFHMRDDSTGANVVDFQINQQGSGNVRFRYSDNNGTNNAVISGFGTISSVTATNFNIVLGLDVLTGNYNINISSDGGASYSEVATGIAIGAADVESIRFAQANGDYSTGNDFLNIGYLGLSNDAADFAGITAVVPEPSSYALIGGLLALGSVMVRRRV